jgi:hypothetical protein
MALTAGLEGGTGRSGALHVLAVTAQMAGDFAEAQERMRARIALARQSGEHATLCFESSNLSMVERQLGNVDEAEALRATP